MRSTRTPDRRVVIDTMVVVRAARAFRQQPPAPRTPELRLVLTWRDDPGAFVWLFNRDILNEYRTVLRRLGVPRQVVGTLINLLRQAGEEIAVRSLGAFSPDPKDDPFYHCAIIGDADYIVTDNLQDFPPIPGRRRPRIITPEESVRRLCH